MPSSARHSSRYKTLSDLIDKGLVQSRRDNVPYCYLGVWPCEVVPAGGASHASYQMRALQSLENLFDVPLRKSLTRRNFLGLCARPGGMIRDVEES